ncbi:MAG: hypothetical protein ACKVZ0_20430 [Gemmatimonadales bacterium]
MFPNRPLRSLAPALAGLLALACADPSTAPPSFARAPADPTVTATDPSAAPRDTTLDVRVLGTGFDNGSVAEFLLAGAVDPKVHTNSTRFVSSKELVASVTIDATAAVAFRDVAVTTTRGKKGIGTEKFLVLSIEQLGQDGGFAQDVNASGLVVGRIGQGCNGQLPATWDPAGLTSFLPLPAGGCSGWAESVNGSGVILGGIRTDPANAGRWSVARWTPIAGGYLAEFLGYWSDGSNIEAGAINAGGNLVATAYTTPWTALWRAPGQPWTHLSVPPGADRCVARGINDADWIVGKCYFAGVASPVLWAGPSGSPIQLPRLAGRNSHQGAEDVNNAGAIAGYAWNRAKNGAIQEMAVRWHFDGAAWQAQSLGSLGGGTSTATAIDEDGAIVGWSTKSGANGALTAFLWHFGGMTDLGALGPESQALGIATGPAGRVTVGGSIVSGSWRPVRWRN